MKREEWNRKTRRGHNSVTLLTISAINGHTRFFHQYCTKGTASSFAALSTAEDAGGLGILRSRRPHYRLRILISQVFPTPAVTSTKNINSPPGKLGQLVYRDRIFIGFYQIPPNLGPPVH